jgi:hypothetical protein
VVPLDRVHKIVGMLDFFSPHPPSPGSTVGADSLPGIASVLDVLQQIWHPGGSQDHGLMRSAGRFFFDRNVQKKSLRGCILNEEPVDDFDYFFGARAQRSKSQNLTKSFILKRLDMFPGGRVARFVKFRDPF